MTQIYRVFTDTPSESFLFTFKEEPELRPNVGDSVTQPLTLRNFRVMRDEFVKGDETRITDTNALIRITDSGLIRVTDGEGADNVTHNYFVQPANNPTRVSTWTRTDFADDQTLKQLFR